MNVWSCKVGTKGTLRLLEGADAPMREAVRRAYVELTGKEPEFHFSGWGTQLDHYEEEVVNQKSQHK